MLKAPFQLRLKRFASLYEVDGSRSRIVSMEGMRGLAVLLVFFVHFDVLFNPYVQGIPSLLAISRGLGTIGHSGVDLFFVLSGYLIYGALLRKKVSYSRFIGRRIERIYPTFVGVFCLYLLLSPLFPSENKIHGPVFAAGIYLAENFFLLPGIFSIKPLITVAWSLSYEFFFYLTIPLLVWITGLTRWRRAYRVGLFIGIWILYLAHAFSVPESRARLLMFVAGILLYETIDSGLFEGKLRRVGEISAIVIFLGSLTFIYLLDAHNHLFSFLPGLQAGRTYLPGVPNYQGPYKVLVLSFSFFLLTLYSFAFSGTLSRIFCWNPLRYLGNMSYSYYLIHGLTLNALSHGLAVLLPPSGNSPGLFAQTFILGLAATWMSATVLFVLVEKPFSLQKHPAGSEGSTFASRFRFYWRYCRYELPASLERHD